ncbi:MAG TPA: class I tRNA ligase family protein [Candidatus Paceibacterota bacterium]
MAEKTNPEPQTEVHAGDALKTVSAQREEAVLSFWQNNHIFEKSLKRESPKGNFVIFDGPPYATGLPHYGHILPSTIKDIIPRYKTMQGYFVPRRWGWDCHGLPIENLIEKQLGLKDKKAIEEYGIGNFNKAAKDSVFGYARDWKRIIGKVGRWVDMENDYHTMDSSYTESVWWSFKALQEKGLVYDAFKVMPYCPRCETSLSNFEVGLGYKDIPDISAYVLFPVLGDGGKATEENFLAWTTTPWTLPGNTALALNPELEYVLVRARTASGSTLVWVAKDLVAGLSAKGILQKPEGDGSADFEALKMKKGSELSGISYTPPFDFYTAAGSLAPDQESKRPSAWKTHVADFVTAEDGTGIVHIAPAFGDDDSKLAHANGIPVIQHVGRDGRLKEGLGNLSGLHAKEKANHQATDIEVIKLLAHATVSDGSPLLFAKEKLVHSYPHCWRCETPLLNYATTSWFVQVTKLKDQLIEANATVNWVPKEVGEGRFGKWLENVRDWAVSRTRYWGAPLPIWKGEKTGRAEFIGSVSELRERIADNGNSFLLMRHGESESNTKNVINSSVADLDLYPLTEAGKTQVEASARAIIERQQKRGKKITRIYASDFRRTKETARQVASALGLDPNDIVFDARIREVNAGDFNGGSWKQRDEYFPTLHERIFKKCPNGESVADLKKRTAEFLYDIESKHKGEDILVVTHGLPLRLMMGTAEGKTSRDMLRSGWRDYSDPTASLHECHFKPLPHNENFELDLHRPFIDEIVWNAQTPDGGTEVMRRIPDVFDVWYDSGSMPFAQNHYPFESKDEFEKEGSTLFPADFISEGIDQTRGWFYSLMVLSVALFGKAPYKNVTVNGLILAEDGRKMSKSLKNYPDLEPTLEKYGGDSLRFMLASSPATHAEEVLFSEKALDEVNKKIFNRLENVYTFYKMYASEGLAGETLSHDSVPMSVHVLDKWIISRLAELKLEVEKNLDLYQIDKAARPINLFVDDISTWYLRRSRDRFKGDDAADKQAAIDTTRFALMTVSKIIAPFVPFMAEHMYQNLKADAAAASSALAVTMPESVHLCDWPTLPEPDMALIDSMASLRKLVETGLALRSKAGIKVRQPLASFAYNAGEMNLSAELAEIAADELNVKNVVAGTEVSLDTELTKELKDEGLVRDVIRAIQEGRKLAGLNPGDSISLELGSDTVTLEILKAYEQMIKKPVLAEAVAYGDVNDAAGQVIEVESAKVSILINVSSHLSN